MRHRLSAAALFAALAFGLAGPAAAAAPAGLARDAVTPAAASQPVEQVQQHWDKRDGRRWNRGDHRWRGERHDRGDRRWDRRDRHWDRGWDRGRDHRRHYRPDAGIYFNFGPPPVYRRYVEPRRVYRYRLSQAHVDWCYARYRSYRASDNTFQPYHGPRRQCFSPYS